MKELNKNYVGLIFGSIVAILHLVWSLLVLSGLAKPLLDWIFWLHFVSIQFVIQKFEITRAVLLVFITFIIGYIVGWISTWLWNLLIQKDK